MERISGFLNQYNNYGTRHSYSSGVNAFLSYIYNYTRKSEGQRISEEDKKQLELLADRYVFEGRDYEKDLIAFSNYCVQKYAPTSGRHYVAVAKEFLSYNDIELTRKQKIQYDSQSIMVFIQNYYRTPVFSGKQTDCSVIGTYYPEIRSNGL